MYKLQQEIKTSLSLQPTCEKQVLLTKCLFFKKTTKQNNHKPPELFI